VPVELDSIDESRVNDSMTVLGEESPLHAVWNFTAEQKPEIAFGTWQVSSLYLNASRSRAAAHPDSRRNRPARPPLPGMSIFNGTGAGGPAML